ncbi:MAG TPA: NAD-dependent protein deacylase [Firmicutes bacterium]|jgi:NAD-dependent deacetylase|nr:NAD-dependent protein deacylase [Bacillota bacterium]
MKKLVVLTGTGISAESGIRTFRDSDGLWHDHDIADVASPEGWGRDPGLVLDFYNQRRRDLYEAKPNAAHSALARAEEEFDVHIITQNIDDLHERAGSARVLHLHGELKKARSTADPSLVYDIEGAELNWGDKCELGSQLRPHIVWFGEAVPAMSEAADIVHSADILAVVGSSLVVYPAAALVQYVTRDTPIFVVDPKDVAVPTWRSITFIRENATTGVPKMLEAIRKLG